MKKILSMGIFFMLILSGLFYANQSAHAHFVEPEKEDVCPVCGMSVNLHPFFKFVG